MSRLQNQLVPLASALLTFLLGCQTPIEQRDWRIVETEHFEFLTDYEDAQAVELASRFEVFHGFMGSLARLDRRDPVIPTRVYLFRDSSTYGRFTSVRSVGLFIDTPRANFIMVGSASGLSGSEIAFHEYSHYLIRSRRLFGYPVWFDEGHADLVSTAQTKDGSFQFGLALQARVRTLQEYGPISIRKLITARDVSDMGLTETNRFYATSWLLVHYLYFSEEARKEKLWQKKDAYMQLINDGVAEEEAFEKAFEMSFDAMSDRIRGYMNVKLGVLSYPLERFAPREAPRVRLANGAEAVEWLGDLALASRYWRYAARPIERSFMLQPERPRTVALLGVIRAIQGRNVEAEELFEKSLRIAPDSVFNHLDYAGYLLSRALQRGPNGVESTPLSRPQRKEYLERARRAYLRVIELDPDHPEAHARMAFTYLYPGEPVSEAVAYADRAFQLLPSEPTIVAQLAEALIAAGRAGEALPLLQRLRPQAARSDEYNAYIDRLIAAAKAGTAP